VGLGFGSLRLKKVEENDDDDDDGGCGGGGEVGFCIFWFFYVGCVKMVAFWVLLVRSLPFLHL